MSEYGSSTVQDVDLSTVDEIAVSPEGDDRVLISWRRGASWSTLVYSDQESGYVDPEDVLWWLLRRAAPLERVRLALAASYPDFDADGEVSHVTMPDRAEWREQDQRRRAKARADFRRHNPRL